MTDDESLNVLKAKSGFSPAERQRALTEAREGILLEIAAAPTPALKARYQRKLNDIEAAYAASNTNTNLPTTIRQSPRPPSETLTEIPAPQPLPQHVEATANAGSSARVGVHKGFIMAGVGVLVLLVSYAAIRFTVRESRSSEQLIATVSSDSVPDSGTSGTTQPNTEGGARERQDYANMKEEMERLKRDIAKSQQQGLAPVVPEAPVTRIPQRDSFGDLTRAPVPTIPPSAGMTGREDYALKVGTSAGERRMIEVVPGGSIPFRWCPPGTFMMGSPGTESGRGDNEKQIDVEITKGFWLAETECTQASWKAVIGANPSHNKASAKLPVEQVTWDDVKGFIEKLNRAGGLPTGWKWALPTEAQWEYACRAGTTSMFPSTGSVNDWGLQNMNGNVYEWCEDRYGEELLGGVDPMGAKTGAYRVYRGGSSYGKVAPCRSAARFDGGSDHRDEELGFRPALIPSR